MLLLIGLPFSQLSRVASSLAETVTVGGVGAESVDSSEGSRRVCLLELSGLRATDASGAAELLEEQAANANAVTAIVMAPAIDLVIVMLFIAFLLLEKLYSVTGQDVKSGLCF